MGFESLVNGVNNFTYQMGAVQGAAQSMGQAAYAVEGAVNQVAGVFTGDSYQPTTPYYPTPVSTLTGGPKAGLVGSLLAGGTVGAVMGAKTADAFRSFKAEGFGAGLKNLGGASLKSGLIGGGIMGLISGVKNMAASSRGEISKAQAGGNVAADTIGGILAGTGAGVTSGFASLLLGKMIPGGGVIATIGSAVAGAVGATGVNFLYDSSGFRDKIANGIAGTPNGNAYGYYQNSPQGTYGY